jgi:hypothetical protein
VVYACSSTLEARAEGSQGFVLFCFFGGTGVSTKGFLTCKAGMLPLEPHLKSILLWLFWRLVGLLNYLLGLASNQNPPSLSLQVAEPLMLSLGSPVLKVTETFF